MKFSKYYGLPAEDIFLLQLILKRMARRRQRYDANMKKKKVLMVFRAALQFELARNIIRERNRLTAASLSLWSRQLHGIICTAMQTTKV